MRVQGRSAVLAVLLAAASTVPAGAATPAGATTPVATTPVATTPAAATKPASTTSASPSGTHSVPPPAPRPTGSGNSPQSPDPHPPRGGIGPTGEAVGGAKLLRRGTVLPPGAPPLPRDITARAWIVVDLDTGDVLAARDPHGRYQPASIEKLLTAVTLLPLLPGGRTVTASRRAANTEGSHAGLVAGGHYTVDEIFRGLLLVSGNDAAEALAEAAGGRAHTVALMNATARALGAYDTFVETPSGLDGWRQLTSAYDMALVLRAALAQPRFLRYDTVRRTHLPAQPTKHVGALELDNQNELFLDTVKGALGAKTGYTDAAQHTFVGAIERGGHRYGVVLLRAQRWPLDQWQQATRLVTWARHLPVGTPAVGRLVTPAPTATTATRSSATPSSAAQHVRLAAGSKPRSSSDLHMVLALLAGAGLLAIAGLLGGVAAVRRR